MISQEFKTILDGIRQMKCETQTLEIKKAKDGAPSRLYDTLSSFSNQDDGGIIVFGIDETNHCLLYTSPSPRDGLLSRMPSSA